MKNLILLVIICTVVSVSAFVGILVFFVDNTIEHPCSSVFREYQNLKVSLNELSSSIDPAVDRAMDSSRDHESEEDVKFQNEYDNKINSMLDEGAKLQQKFLDLNCDERQSQWSTVTAMHWGKENMDLP